MQAEAATTSSIITGQGVDLGGPENDNTRDVCQVFSTTPSVRYFVQHPRRLIREANEARIFEPIFSIVLMANLTIRRSRQGQIDSI